MKVADFWLEAAQMAETWAGIGRAYANRQGVFDREITAETARHLSLLAEAFRHLATEETREIDLEDRVTPVLPEYQVEQVDFLDDDPTDPD